MTTSTFLRAIATAALLLVPQIGWSVFDPVNDDTDIFLANPAFSAERPNVLIFIDNTANWNTAFQTEKDGLISVFSGLTDAYNVGIAMFVETGGGNDSVDGGYIRFGIRQMTATNKSALSTMVYNLDRLGDKSNNAVYSLAMGEMYRYFAGVASNSGYGKVKRDYAGNSANNPAAANLPRNPFTSAASTTYVSPIVNGCQRNFIIFISNGPAGDNSSSLSEAQSHLATLVGKNPPDTLTISPNGEQGLWSDEYAKFMSNSDCNANFDGVQNVYTYTLDVLPAASGQGPSHTAQLQSMASSGKGKYFPITDTSNTTQFTAALNAIFQEVQAVNSVFASTTLPVSVNVRGTNLNQVYIGVFRPDSNKSPRWLGNLKLYRLGLNTANNTLFLADSNGNAAENSSTGFITGSAVSYWTSGSTYWGFRDPTLNGIGGSSDSPDGDLVEKGGTAQKVRIAYPSDQATRKLYTCVNATQDGLCASTASLSSTPFNNTNVTAGDLNAFTTYAVSSIGTSGSQPQVATLTLAAAPSPAWAAGNQIKVEGATPAVYNGLFPLDTADNTTFTYTYTLPSAPDASSAEAAATGHGLQTGDLVSITVSGAGAAFSVTDASVVRLGPNSFRYTVSGATGSTSSGITATGKKSITSVSGSGNLATAVVAGHGYSTGNTVTISGANESAFDKINVTITVVDANSFTYSTSPDVITGASNTAKVTATAHNVSTNQAIRITGNSISSYNGLFTATKLDDNSLTFPSTEVLSGAGGVVGLQVVNFSHPTTGSSASRNVLTVATEAAHNISGPFPYSITITGATGGFAVYNGTWSIASSADVPSTTTFRITNATFNTGSNGAPGGTVIAGKPITTVNPVVSATGTILSEKSVTVQSITSATNATGAITAGRPADSSVTVRDQIIAWVRGADNRDDEDPVTTPAGSDIRPSIHGDVLHSRPAVVNYNRYGDDDDIYAFYGGNDGIFRALKAGIANHATGPDTAINPGSERWGFIGREFFGKLKRLREQSPAISALTQKDYFADGSIGVYLKDVAGTGNVAAPGPGTVSGVIGDNSADKVYLYISMRRGGDFLYALDVTDPANPKLLWRKGFGDAGWEQLGMTWSEPKIAKVQVDLGNPGNPENIVVIFGAGYDNTVEDVNRCLLNQSTLTNVQVKAIGTGTVTYTSDGTCTIASPTGSPTTVSRTRGRGILVVDAFTGNVVWQASAGVTSSAASTSNPTLAPRKLQVPDMSCAIPSDATVLDKNRDGFADRIYVGDTCGQVWRADITGSNIDEWSVTKIAAISSSTDTDIANKRKFLFPPDLVFGTDASGNYTAVLIGSGDREHPFDTTVANRFYMFKDRNSSDPGNPETGAFNSTSVKISGFSPAPSGSPDTDSTVFDATNAIVDGTDPLGLNGWKVRLASGEKVVSSATTVSGTTFFNTNQPSSSAGGGSCGSNLGIARQYLIGFADASATIDLNGTGGITLADRSMIHSGGGYLPSPVPLVVDINGTKQQGVCSGVSCLTPPGLTLERRTRTYWYKELD
jgi:type IV pilus assembly protein PilY1